MTSLQIPLDAVGEALVSALWTGLHVSLGIKTCQQSIFEPMAITSDLANIFPALRVMEPAWQRQGSSGSNPSLPVVEGQMSYLVAYGRLFAITDTSEAWSRQLMQDVQQITSLLWQGDMQIPGFTVPAGLVVKGVSIDTVGAAASPADEELGVRIAEAQIRISINVMILGDR